MICFCDLIKTIHILSTNLPSFEGLSCILSGLQENYKNDGISLMMGAYGAVAPGEGFGEESEGICGWPW